MAFIMHGIGATSFAIGTTPYDPQMTPIVTQPLRLFGPALLARALAALAPLPLLLIPLALFHRFDPVKVKDTSKQGGRGPIARLNQLVKPVTRVLAPVIALGGRLPWRFGGRVIADAAVTLALFPLAVLLLVGVAAWSLTVPIEGLRRKVLPALFFLLVIVLPGISTRDRIAGTMPMLDGIARLKVDRVAWKLGTAFVVALLFALVPLLRLAVAAAVERAVAAGRALLHRGAVHRAGRAVPEPQDLRRPLPLLPLSRPQRRRPGGDGLRGVVRHRDPLGHARLPHGCRRSDGRRLALGPRSDYLKRRDAEARRGSPLAAH